MGTRKGFDQTIHLILGESHKSECSALHREWNRWYIVRGDSVAVIGEMDDETDSALDLGNIQAEPLNSVAH